MINRIFLKEVPRSWRLTRGLNPSLNLLLLTLVNSVNLSEPNP